MRRLLAQGASALNFQSDGTSNKRQRDIIGILKKFKDSDPADSHHASLDTAEKRDIVTSK